jgi:uncharacterized protein (TIGR02001 family)
MKNTLGAIGGAFLLGVLSAPLSAQTLSFGGTLTSDFISRGVSQTGGGAALQGSVEYQINGFYAGLWASNISAAPDTLEVDATIGYRWDLGTASVDIGYARYFYNVSGDQGGELYLLGESNLGATDFFGGVYLSFPGAITVSDVHIGVSYAITDQIAVSGTVGSATAGTYANLGTTFSVTDNLSLDARYHLMAVGGNRLNASLNFNF